VVISFGGDFFSLRCFELFLDVFVNSYTVDFSYFLEFSRDKSFFVLESRVDDTV
jgi:hypothetical protein